MQSIKEHCERYLELLKEQDDLHDSMTNFINECHLKIFAVDKAGKLKEFSEWEVTTYGVWITTAESGRGYYDELKYIIDWENLYNIDGYVEELKAAKENRARLEMEDQETIQREKELAQLKMLKDKYPDA